MKIKAIEGLHLSELVTETDVQIGSILKEFAAEMVIRWNRAESNDSFGPDRYED